MKINKKQKKWDKEAERCLKIADRLGLPIDPGIMDFVITLNLLGFLTRCSCEGHNDKEHIVSYPFVDITSKKALAHMKVRKELFQKQEEKKISEKLFGKKFHENEKIRRKELARFSSNFEPYLDLFYKNRKVNYDSIITMDPGVIDVRIQPSGHFIQFSRTQLERDKRVKRYQKEFRDLTEFLKKKYFSSK